MGDQDVVLALSNLRKAFGGIQAVWDFSLNVERNTVHSIIGPNGAGKSTLFNLITGEIPPDSGHVKLFGLDITHSPVRRRKFLGLGRTYQTPNLFMNLTVKESLFLAWNTGNARLLEINKAWVQCQQEIIKVRETARMVGLEDRLETQVVNLAHGEQRRLGIGMALAGNPHVLLLDEPAAGLTSAERIRLAELIDSLRTENKLTVLLIDHDVSFVLDLADWITVMDQGRVVVTGRPNEVQRNPKVQEIYYGKGESNDSNTVARDQ
jgi:branched-chain amino acid transport system ATP-binding protein